MGTFSVRELRERADELIRVAESGRISVITKDGRPLLLAVPFDEASMRDGIGLGLAVRLFQQSEISLGKAARLSGINRQSFMAELTRRGIPVTHNCDTKIEQSNR